MPDCQTSSDVRHFRESTSGEHGHKTERPHQRDYEFQIKTFVFICLASCFTLLSSSCSAPAPVNSARIAVAANFNTTLKLLETDFESRTAYRIDIVSGSTGKLYAQIINGAPYDVFLSADQMRPRRLAEKGHAAGAKPVTYAIGKLALWSAGDLHVTPDTLIAPGVSRLAIANPDLAPYGLAAIQVLERLELEAQLRPKFVFGENVGQTFAFVSTGNAQIGFVSVAQIQALPDTAPGSAWLIPPQLHEPIAQDALLLAEGRDNSAALAFMAYLQSAEARDIMARAGYELP